MLFTNSSHFVVSWYFYSIMFLTFPSQQATKAHSDLPTKEDIKSRLTAYRNIRHRMNISQETLSRMSKLNIEIETESWFKNWEARILRFSRKPGYSECNPGESLSKLKIVKSGLHSYASKCSQDAMQGFFFDFIELNKTIVALEVALNAASHRNATTEILDEDDEEEVVDDGDPIFSGVEIAAVLSCAPEPPTTSTFNMEAAATLKHAVHLAGECFKYYGMERTSLAYEALLDFTNCMSETTPPIGYSPLRDEFNTKIRPLMRSLTVYRKTILVVYNKTQNMVARRLDRWLPTWVDALGEIDEPTCTNPNTSLHYLNANLAAAGARCLADAFDYLTNRDHQVEESVLLIVSLAEAAESVIKPTPVAGLSKVQISNTFEVYLGHIVSRIREKAQIAEDTEPGRILDALVRTASKCWNKEIKFANSKAWKLVKEYKDCIGHNAEVHIPYQDHIDAVLEEEMSLSLEYLSRWYQVLLNHFASFSWNSAYAECLSESLRNLQRLHEQANQRVLKHLEQTYKRLCESTVIAWSILDIIEYIEDVHPEDVSASSGLKKCLYRTMNNTTPVSKAFYLGGARYQETIITQLYPVTLQVIMSFRTCLNSKTNSRKWDPYSVEEEL